MKRTAPVPLLVLAAVLGAAAARAEEDSPLRQVPTPPARPVPAAPSRAVSPEVAARLAAALPKYTPPPAPAPAEPGPDRREADPPRNRIIRLPSYVVREQRVPSFKERELLTPQGRLDLGFKRHPGLRIGNLFGLNGAWALAMVEEEERLERMAEFYDLVSLLPTAEAKNGKALADETFARSNSAPSVQRGPWGGLVVPWERR